MRGPLSKRNLVLRRTVFQEPKWPIQYNSSSVKGIFAPSGTQFLEQTPFPLKRVYFILVLSSDWHLERKGDGRKMGSQSQLRWWYGNIIESGQQLLTSYVTTLHEQITCCRSLLQYSASRCFSSRVGLGSLKFKILAQINNAWLLQALPSCVSNQQQFYSQQMVTKHPACCLMKQAKKLKAMISEASVLGCLKWES